MEFVEDCRNCGGTGLEIRKAQYDYEKTGMNPEEERRRICRACYGKYVVPGTLTYKDCVAIEVMKEFASKPKNDSVKDIATEAYLWAAAMAAEREKRQGDYRPILSSKEIAADA